MVHHITPIGELSQSADYVGRDPSKDLIPFCSNCHAMIHRVKPELSAEELKEKLNK